MFVVVLGRREVRSPECKNFPGDRRRFETNGEEGHQKQVAQSVNSSVEFGEANNVGE